MSLALNPIESDKGVPSTDLYEWPIQIESIISQVELPPWRMVRFGKRARANKFQAWEN